MNKLLLTALSLFTLTTFSSAADPKPNIIFILVDDVGIDWYSCYGSSHPTPNVDRLAASGVRFSTCFATPLCTPTRHEMLTGRYPFRTGWTAHHDVPRWGGPGMDPAREITWARLLRDAGYATAISGKWQINDLRKDPDILKKHGFDEHCVWTGVESGNPPSEERYWNPYLQINGQRTIHTGRFGPDLCDDFVLDFIKRHKDRPFAIYYPQIMAHAPYAPTPLNKNNPPKKNAALFAAEIDYTDLLLGKLLKTLDDLNIADRTIVVFAGDNGSSVPGVLNGKTMPHGKAQLSNSGVQVPLIVRAPMLTRGGIVSNDLVDFSDLFPSFLQFAGLTPPATLTLDGHSFLHSLTSTRAPTDQRQWIFSQLAPKGRIIRDSRYLLTSTGAFFDIQNDPAQKTDLRNSSAPDLAAAREKLQKALASLPPDAPHPFTPFAKSSTPAE